MRNRLKHPFSELHRWGVLVALLLSYHVDCLGVIAPQVKLTVDTTQIRIGEQIRLNLSAIAAKGTLISFPVIGDTLHGLEVVSKGKIDTLSGKDADTLSLQQQISITGFDSGYYVLEPFPVVFNGHDTLSTEAQLISVRTIPIDTTKAFKDIKPVMDPPFDWREWMPYLFSAILLLLAAVVGYFLYRKWKNKPVVPVLTRKPDRPAHEIALEALSVLEKEKLWQQGSFKEYHIRLTDIIRSYIDQRYGITSMEFTTDETLQALRRIPLEATTLQPLEVLLRLADLVKFAKSVPVGPENEQSLASARTFIQITSRQQQHEEVKP